MIIFKYPVSQGRFSHSLPRGSKILDVQVQGSRPVMWVLIDQSRTEETRHFVTVPTGMEFDTRDLDYVGTFQLSERLVFHLFQY